MIKKMICIECPQSCALTVDIENCRIVKIDGHKCPKGKEYATTEIENPHRILTGTVLTKDLPLKMIPVRTDKAIPKAKILAAASEMRRIKVTKFYRIGDVVVPNFMGLEVNLIATRNSSLK